LGSNYYCNKKSSLIYFAVVEMKPVDPASVAHLKGIFAPIQDEIDVGLLEVVQGSIPRELTGVYLRNGPNCRFPPLGSYTYPLDGDGMLHAIELADGQARYRNRYVCTPGLAAEERAGRALWGGVLTPVFPSTEEVGPELAGQFKDLPDVSVIRHAGQYLALAESARPFRVTRELTTLGPWDFGGGLPQGICAHPKIDPVTGELVVFRYGFAPPYLTWATVGPDGAVSQREQAIDLDRPHMIHDFGVTEQYVILFVCPAVFDATGAAAAVLQWRPELGTRIALLPRRGSADALRWVNTEPFWVWHFANAFEAAATDGSTTIIVDFPRWSHLGLDRSASANCGVVRAEIDVTRRSIRIDQRDDRMTEFPRIDDRRIGRPHRWFYVASKEPAGQPLPPGEWNELSRYDTQTGQVITRKAGALRLGEPVFAPAGPAAAEDQGYVVTFATDTATLESYFLILQAADIAGEPAAILRIPHRVPAGLHGCWVPGR
jgi:carotenoid cleavage dioxygenase-like enzyme